MKKAKKRKLNSFDFCYHPETLVHKTEYSYSHSEQVYYAHTSYKCKKCKKIISAIELSNARDSW
jgi:hypothetical protein